MFYLFIQMHVFTKCLSMEGLASPSWPTLVYSCMEKTRWSYYHFHSCMMISIMLVDSPPLDTEKLDLRWDPFLEKESCFIKTKGFMKTLGGIFPTEWVYKMELLWRSMVLENVFGWKKVFDKATHGSLQLSSTTSSCNHITLRWDGA